jgi:phytanoyl-CoA dioxygenase PhyH
MALSESHSRSFSGLDPAAFRERGYAVVRQLFDVEEIQRLRASAREAFAEGEREGLITTSPGIEGTIRHRAGDLLSISSLRHVLLDARVLEVVRELLGGEPAYFGDSSVRIGKNGQRAWHRDNVHRRRWRRGPDWQDPYPLLRCGLYMQDQSRHSGGLALRPRSNRPGLFRPTLPMLVDAREGDFVVWQLRTVHSGEVVRMRWLPDVPLHPRVQTRLPQSMRAPEDAERIVMFMTFARPGAQLDYYMDYLKTRHEMQSAWASSHFGSEVWQAAAEAGLQVIQPVPEYGTLQ